LRSVDRLPVVRVQGEHTVLCNHYTAKRQTGVCMQSHFKPLWWGAAHPIMVVVSLDGQWRCLGSF